MKKVYEVVKKNLNIIEKILNDELVYFALLICLFSPIVLNFNSLQWYYKILMISGSILAILELFFLIMDYVIIKNKKNYLFYYVPFIILFKISIIAYFDFNIFGIKEFMLGLFIIYMIFLFFSNMMNLLFGKSFLSDKLTLVLFSSMFTILTIGAITESSDNFYEALVLYKIGIGLAYLNAIYLIIYKYLYSKEFIGIGKRIIGILVCGSFVIFSFPYYIKWCGINGETFSTFLMVYTSTIGGGLTLIGVAWTINRNNEDKKKDIKLSVKPWIYPVSCKSEYNSKEQIDVVFYVQNDKCQVINFVGIIKNTDNGILIIKEAIVNGRKCEMKFPIVLDKNIPARIIIYSTERLNVESLYILGNDILGNLLKYKIIVDNEKKDIDSIQEDI